MEPEFTITFNGIFPVDHETQSRKLMAGANWRFPAGTFASCARQARVAAFEIHARLNV
jgi:hypothetical protein